jgi:membrane protease YdiL (CAAX protease family)
LFYRWLRKYLGALSAAFLSGLVFAACHFNLHQLILIAVPGITLGLVVERSRSLWASIITHGLYNLSVTLWMLFGT